MFDSVQEVKMKGHIFKSSLAILVVVLCVKVMAGQQVYPPELFAYADTVLYNGKILTADDQFTMAQAVAIRDGKFLAVGETSRILQLAGPQSRRIDLQGKTVVPGFMDTHLHSAFMNISFKSGQSGKVRLESLEGGLKEIEEFVKSAQPGEWVNLAGPRGPAFAALRKEHLDKVAPNNPLTVSASSDDFVANSLVMDKLSPDIPGIEKDPTTGETNGVLHGWSVGVVQWEIMPWNPPPGELLESQKEDLLKLNRLGLTTLMGKADGRAVSVLKELWGKEELTMRVRLAHQFLWQNPHGEPFLKRLGNLSGFGDDMMKIMGLSIQPVDGSISSGSALTFNPKIREFSGNPYGLYGQHKWIDTAGEQWRTLTDHENVLLANRYGWTVTSLHTGGDQAAAIHLEVYDKANQEKPLTGRWGMDHLNWVTPESMEMMKKLGVIPSVYHRSWGSVEGLDKIIFQYGADAIHRMFPAKSMIQAGLKPVAEADADVLPMASPLWNIEKFVSRKDEGGRVWGADEKLTRREALNTYTNWAAYYSGDEERLGTIEPGKLADLVVLDGDFLEVPEDEIGEIPISLTMVDGKVVYQQEGR